MVSSLVSFICLAFVVVLKESGGRALVHAGVTQPEHVALPTPGLRMEDWRPLFLWEIEHSPPSPRVTI